MVLYDKVKFVANPLVSVNVLTYNQEDFIRETLDSILAQECNFDYEVIVGEDCSTDHTRDVCMEYQRKYPERIKLVLPDKNGGLMVNYVNVRKEDRGKYSAGCAGDDFWCDTKKLQKQVDYLETHPEYGVCLTACYLQFKDGRRQFHPKYYTPCENGDVRHLAMCGPLGPAGTQMVRRDLYQYIHFDEIIEAGIYAEDYITNAIWSMHTKFAFLDDITLVWRMSENSISNDKSLRYRVGVVRVRKYLLSHFPDQVPYSAEALDDEENYIRLKYAIKDGDYRKALEYKRLLHSYKRKRYAQLLLGPITGYILKQLWKK